jgi:ATP-dependent DNA ligase
MMSLRTSRCPFDRQPRERAVSWVRPALVAQAAFEEWTKNGKLRQPAFLGLRDDKAASECRWRERDR